MNRWYSFRLQLECGMVHALRTPNEAPNGAPDEVDILWHSMLVLSVKHCKHIVGILLYAILLEVLNSVLLSEVRAGLFI